MILSPAIVTFLYTRVGPKVLYRFHIWTHELRYRLEVDGPNELGFFLKNEQQRSVNRCATLDLIFIGVCVNFNSLGGINCANRCQENKEATYYIRRLRVLNLQKIHCTYHGLHSHENVLVDQLDKTSFVLVRVSGPVDNSHLFDKCRFAGFTSTCNDETCIRAGKYQWSRNGG